MRNRAIFIILLVSALVSIFGILNLLQAHNVAAQKIISGEQIVNQHQNSVDQVELNLTKKGHPNVYDHVGRIITYNYVIKNISALPITGTFSVTDDKTTVTCTQPIDGVLSPGEKMYCTAPYTITQNDLDVGSVTNLATATGGGFTSNLATDTITAIQTMSLQLTKVADPLVYDHIGQVINYSYVILNIGNVTLTGIFSVTDDKTSATCTQPADGALSPGEAMDCTAIYTITQADLDAGIITNIATATGAGVTSNQASVTVSAVQTRSLFLNKTAEPLLYDTVGQAITYTYMITNTGNVTLAGTFSIVDNKATVACTQPADGALSPNERMSCSATHNITQSDLDAGSLTNTATASGAGVTSNTDAVTVNAAQTISLLLAKVAYPLVYDHVGETITYTYVITNMGNITLTGIFSVTDDKASVTCAQPGDGALSPKETMNCTAPYTITQTDLDAGSVTNLATASGGGATSNQVSETITALQTTSLLLTKAANPQVFDHLGQVITYIYGILNTGNVTLTGVFSVTDDKTTVTCTQPVDGALTPGEGMSCTANYTITQLDLDSGSVTNLATASGAGVTSNQATETITAVQTFSLLLSKTANPLTYDHVGQIIIYTYGIKNNSNVTLTGVFSVADDKATVTCTQPPDGALSPGETMSCSATYTITQGDLDAGSVVNFATAMGAGEISNVDTATAIAAQNISLLLTKLADPQSYDHVGQTIIYSYVITNIGNVTLTGIFSVTDDKSSVTCTQPPDGALSPNEAMSCTASYAVTQADLDAGNLTNLATASGAGATSNQASETVTAVQTMSLLLSKTANPLVYDHVGQVINYGYVILNTGNVTLTSIFSVTDDKTTVICTQPADGALSPGETMDCTATYAITQGDMDAGSVTNLATASGAGVTSNQATQTATAVQIMALHLSKSAQPLAYDHAGQVIAYTYVIRNTGNVTLTGTFSVTDDKVTVTCTQPGDGSLSPDETMGCTASYTITQNDMDGGSVTNLAAASGGGISSNQVSATITASQSSKLLLTKNAVPLIYDHVGQMINYTYTVENNGNVTLTGPFTVFDDKVTNESCPANPTSLGPGQSITCTASYTILLGDMVSGIVTNNAYATGNFGASTVTSNTVSKTVRANRTLTYTFIPVANKPYPPGIYVLPGSSNYVSGGTIFVIGEVLNNTNNSLNWVGVTVDFFDASGHLLATKFIYMWPLDLPAKVKGCFKTFITPVPQNWSYYRFESPIYSISSTSLGLVIFGDSGAYNPGNGDYNIDGQVQNNGNLPSVSVYVSGTLYNSSGVPVGCETTENGINLNPGQNSAFQIPYLGSYHNYSDVAYYKLRVVGDLP